MKKFGVLKNYKREADSLNKEILFDKVLYDVKTGDVFFVKTHDGVLEGENLDLNRIDLASEILEEGISYSYSILGISKS